MLVILVSPMLLECRIRVEGPLGDSPLAQRIRSMATTSKVTVIPMDSSEKRLLASVNIPETFMPWDTST